MKSKIKFVVDKSNPHIRKKDVQQVGEFLYNRCSGMKTKQILEMIKQNKNHPIYKYIEWNDKKASYQYRLHQVRVISATIKCEVKFIGNKKPQTIRAMFNVREKGQKVFVNTATIFSVDRYKNQVIKRALNELKAWTERYEMYGELSALRNNIETIMSERYNEYFIQEENKNKILKKKKEKPIVYA